MEELVDTLSDEDLYYRLKEFKPDLGPVVDSTRTLYKRLLLKALMGDADAKGLLNSSNDILGSPDSSPAGPVTRSKTTSAPDADEGDTTEENSDQEDTEEDANVAEDDFEILESNQELDGEDAYFQRHSLTTDTVETNNFLIKTVVIGFIFAVLAIIAVAVWIPPTKKM